MENNRVWIYARVVHEDSIALECQKNQLEIYAREHGMNVAGITAEYGSGCGLSRPGINELDQAVEKGLADILLVKRADRFERGFIQTAEYLKWLEQKGIRVVCMDEPAFGSPVLADMVMKAVALKAEAL